MNSKNYKRTIHFFVKKTRLYLVSVLVIILPLDSWTADLGVCPAMFTACVDTLLEFVIQMGDIWGPGLGWGGGGWLCIEIHFWCEAACWVVCNWALNTSFQVCLWGNRLKCCCRQNSHSHTQWWVKWSGSELIPVWWTVQKNQRIKKSVFPHL